MRRERECCDQEGGHGMDMETRSTNHTVRCVCVCVCVFVCVIVCLETFVAMLSFCLFVFLWISPTLHFFNPTVRIMRQF